MSGDRQNTGKDAIISMPRKAMRDSCASTYHTPNGPNINFSATLSPNDTLRGTQTHQCHSEAQYYQNGLRHEWRSTSRDLRLERLRPKDGGGYCVPLNSKVPSTNGSSLGIVSSISAVSGPKKQDVIRLDVYATYQLTKWSEQRHGRRARQNARGW